MLSAVGDVELAEQRVQRGAAHGNRQPRDERERRHVRKREHVDEPRNSDTVRVREVVRAAGMAGHPFVERLVAAEAVLVSDQQVGEPDGHQAEQANAHRGRLAAGVNEA